MSNNNAAMVISAAASSLGQDIDGIVCKQIASIHRCVPLIMHLDGNLMQEVLKTQADYLF